MEAASAPLQIREELFDGVDRMEKLESAYLSGAGAVSWPLQWSMVGEERALPW